jgi:prepilin-type N-terminal cleavage/methylation domain-containing protein
MRKIIFNCVKCAELLEPRCTPSFNRARTVMAELTDCHIGRPRQRAGTKAGFTLIELIVVISLISLMLFFAIPRFGTDFVSDDLNTVSRWIILKVRTLKEQAFLQQKRYVLHVDMAANRLWISNDAMSEEELEKAAAEAYQLPEDVKLIDVAYPLKGLLASGEAEIWFFKSGYSEKALIHIGNDADDKRTFLIEPFLPTVKFFEEEVGFEG